MNPVVQMVGVAEEISARAELGEKVGGGWAWQPQHSVAAAGDTGNDLNRQLGTTGWAVGPGDRVEPEGRWDADRVKRAPGVVGSTGNVEAMPGVTQREAVDTHHAASLVHLGASLSNKRRNLLLDVARRQFHRGQRTSVPESYEPRSRQARGDVAHASA